MKITTWMSMALLRLAGVVILVGCAGEAPPQHESTAKLQFRARTVVGEPLGGVVVRTQGALRPEWLTDESGSVVIEGRIGEEDLEIDAACPDEFVGQAVQRKISAPVLVSMLDKQGQWSLELVCQSQNPQLPLAVLSEGCGDVKMSLGDVPLGATNGGAFHALIDLPLRSTFEINVESLEEGCEVTQPSRLVTLNSPSPSVFLRVASRPKQMARIRRSILSREKVHKRPYRL